MTGAFQTIDPSSLLLVTGGRKDEDDDDDDEQSQAGQFGAMFEQGVRGIVAEMLQSMSGPAAPAKGAAPAKQKAPKKK